MNPDKQALLALVLRTARAPAPARPLAAQHGGVHADTADLPEVEGPPSVRPRRGNASVRSQFADWLRELERFLPAPSEPELDEYYRYALMGVVVGFGDRNLSPYLDQHTAIIPPLLADIRSVYEQVRDSGAAYSPEAFIFRAYDYGIHKAYYLDWDLYLSKDMY